MKIVDSSIVTSLLISETVRHEMTKRSLKSYGKEPILISSLFPRCPVLSYSYNGVGATVLPVYCTHPYESFIIVVKVHVICCDDETLRHDGVLVLHPIPLNFLQSHRSWTPLTRSSLDVTKFPRRACVNDLIALAYGDVIN